MGKAIHLSQTSKSSDVDAVTSMAQGRRAFRTEFLFINRDNLPGEEDQYKVYRQVAAA